MLSNLPRSHSIICPNVGIKSQTQAIWLLTDVIKLWMVNTFDKNVHLCGVNQMIYNNLLSIITMLNSEFLMEKKELIITDSYTYTLKCYLIYWQQQQRQRNYPRVIDKGTRNIDMKRCATGLRYLAAELWLDSVTVWIRGYVLASSWEGHSLTHHETDDRIVIILLLNRQFSNWLLTMRYYHYKHH